MFLSRSTNLLFYHHLQDISISPCRQLIFIKAASALHREGDDEVETFNPFNPSFVFLIEVIEGPLLLVRALWPRHHLVSELVAFGRLRVSKTLPAQVAVKGLLARVRALVLVEVIRV